MLLSIIIFLVIIILYVYLIKLAHPDYVIRKYSDIKDRVKSGDMLLFVSGDTNNQIYMGSYATHVGVIYKETENSIPVLAESFNPYRMLYYPDEFKSGIAICDLENRINSYRGFIIYKELAKPISDQANEDFAEFIDFAQKNMCYDKNVIAGEAAKIILNTPFSTETNCGQFTTLILIKLGLLSFNHFKERRKHHLRFVSQLTKLRNNFYKSPVYVFSEYFKLP